MIRIPQEPHTYRIPGTPSLCVICANVISYTSFPHPDYNHHSCLSENNKFTREKTNEVVERRGEQDKKGRKARDTSVGESQEGGWVEAHSHDSYEMLFFHFFHTGELVLSFHSFCLPHPHHHTMDHIDFSIKMVMDPSSSSFSNLLCQPL